MLQVLILAIIQGLTEFLPVSSDGHLVLAGHWLGTLDQQFLNLVIFLHAGSLFVLISYYWKDLWRLGAGMFGQGPDRAEQRKLLGAILLGTLITGVLGLTFKDAVEVIDQEPRYASLGLLFTGLELLSLRWIRQGSVREVRWPIVVLVALFQALAILPGVSRSGSTIAVALWAGLEPGLAVRFSFLLGIPAIGGALLLDLRHLHKLPFSASNLALGLVVCTVVSWVALRLVIRFVEKGRIHQFGYYCLGLGAGSLAWLLLRGS